MAIRALIVDDEDLARRGIRTRLQRFSDVDIVAESTNARQAIDAINRYAPDLVFLDVEMPGMTGFDVIDHVGCDVFPQVIFVTAYDQYAIRAFEVNAVDYLLKPIDDERFDLALERAQDALAQERDRDLGRRLTLILNQFKKSASTMQSERLVVRSAGRVVFVKTSEIDWVEAAGDYVTLHVGKKSWLLRETISEMDKKLECRGFTRVHRSSIVNTERISEMRSLDNGEYRLFLRDGTELKLSRSYRHQLEASLG